MASASIRDLLSPDFVKSFDRLTLLVTKLLDTPVSIFSIVDAENKRQYFKSFMGLPEPWAGKRETPLSHSFCQHVRYFERPLIVEDAREHDVLRYNLAVRDIGVIAYLGFPVFDESNEAIGSLCAIDSKPRAWSECHVEIMRSLTATLNEIVKQQAEVRAQQNEVNRLQDCLDRSRATLRSRERFYAFLCHELRTPLSGIIGGVRLAEHSIKSSNGVKGPEIGKMLKTMSSSALSMKRTVDDILEFSRLESDMFELVHNTFNLRELTEEIIGQHSGAAEDKGISLGIDWNISGGLEKRFGDGHRIGQLLQNLLSNAIRFTDEGGVTVSISGDDKRLRIQVKDTGEGMTQDQLDRLFSPFRQGDGRISSRKGGSGLGMAITDRIVQAMSGQIEVQSEPGGGTSITLLLPIPSSHHRSDEASEQMSSSTLVAASLKGRSLLIFEPNDTSRELSVETLEGLGATVQVANDAEDAIAKALSPYVDSIVLDFGDANIGGSEIIKTCRDAEGKSDLPKLHAVALLPTKSSQAAETVRVSGFNSYVRRPVSRSAFVEALS